MRKDILLAPTTGDLAIKNGDFVVGPSDLQHVVHILHGDEGQCRQYPLMCVGIRKYLNGIIDGRVRRLIQLKLEADGYKPRKIQYKNGQLKVEI